LNVERTCMPRNFAVRFDPKQTSATCAQSDPNLTPDHLHSAVDNIVALGDWTVPHVFTLRRER
jgi:hypothetical protein